MNDPIQEKKMSLKRKIIIWAFIISTPLLYFLLGSIDTSKDDYSAVIPIPRTAPLKPEENSLHLIKPLYTRIENTAPWLQKLYLDFDSKESPFHPDHPYDLAYWQLVLDEHKEDLLLLKQAYSMKACYEEVDYDINSPHPHLDLIRINHLLGVSTRYHFHQKNWEEALEELWLARHFSTIHLSQSESFLGAIIAVALDAQIYNLVNLLAELPDVPERVIRESIKILSEPRLEIAKKAISRGYRHEFKEFQYLVEDLSNGRKKDVLRYMEAQHFGERERYTPFHLHVNRTVNAQAKITARYLSYESMTPSEILADYTKLQDELNISKLNRQLSPNGGGKYLVAAVNSPIIGRQALRARICQMHSDLSRLKLALRLHYKQHGELPDTLEEVYAHIGGPVVDHFARTPKPYCYSKSRARIWSRFDNLVDDGGWDSHTDYTLRLRFAEKK